MSMGVTLGIPAATRAHRAARSRGRSKVPALLVGTVLLIVAMVASLLVGVRTIAPRLRFKRSLGLTRHRSST